MFCPPVSRLAHQFAVASEHVVADVIDVEALPSFAQTFRVTSVPKVLFNASGEVLGSQTESSLLDGLEVVLRDGRV
jgi:hypothetical protein